MHNRKVSGADEHTGTNTSAGFNMDRVSPVHLYVRPETQREMKFTNEDVRESYIPKARNSLSHR